MTGILNNSQRHAVSLQTQLVTKSKMSDQLTFTNTINKWWLTRLILPRSLVVGSIIQLRQCVSNKAFCTIGTNYQFTLQSCKIAEDCNNVSS